MQRTCQAVFERLVDPAAEPIVMGILNATPDSFFANSRGRGWRGLAAALRLEQEGADILDIGGESTRPGAAYVSEAAELRRVVPLVEKIRARSSIPISVDTRKFAVARAAIEAGADIINDVSALEDDPRLLDYLVDNKVPVVLMHKKGSPQTMQDNPQYGDAVGEIGAYLRGRSDLLLARGFPRERIVLDPGIGFGKTIEHNLDLIANLDRLIADSAGHCAGLLLGYSRKGFLGTLLAQEKAPDRRHKAGGSAEAGMVPRPIDGRLHGGLAVLVWALERGVRCVRVHDVAAARDAVRVWNSVRAHRAGRDRVTRGRG